MMATTVEAIVGAVYLDGGNNGLAAVKGVMQTLGIAYTGPVI
jgi:dsRNA-specific ribonuclease